MKRQPIAKSCGTCKYWRSDKSKDPRNEYMTTYHGTCEWSLTNSVIPFWVCWGFTNEENGVNCPTYKRKVKL